MDERQRALMEVVRRAHGLDPNSSMTVFSRPGFQEAKLDDCYVESVGVFVDGRLPEEYRSEDAPFFHIGPLYYIILLTRVYRQDSTVVGELRWHPKTGHVASIHGPKIVDWDRDDVEKMHTAMRRLVLLSTQIGRPLGSGKLDDLPPEAIIDEYRRLREAGGDRVTHLDLATRLGVSESTLRRYRKKHGLEWRHMQASASF